MSEQKITIPEGYKLQKINDSEYRIVKKEKELPNSWTMFCYTHPVKKGEAWIGYNSEIVCGEKTDIGERDNGLDKNILPNKEYAEAILTLCQLIQLRDCYRQGWKPDWSDVTMRKYSIHFKNGYLQKEYFYEQQHIFCFQSSEIRDKFYNNFNDLIEKIKPLFM